MHWVAHYPDRLIGESEQKYSQLERAKLLAFDLMLGERLLVRVDLQADSFGPKALIYRRRVQQSIGGEQISWYIIGFKQQDIHHIIYVFEDGTVLLGGQPEAGKMFQEPIEPFVWEVDLQWP